MCQDRSVIKGRFQCFLLAGLVVGGVFVSCAQGAEFDRQATVEAFTATLTANEQTEFSAAEAGCAAAGIVDEIGPDRLVELEIDLHLDSPFALLFSPDEEKLVAAELARCVPSTLTELFQANPQMNADSVECVVGEISDVATGLAMLSSIRGEQPHPAFGAELFGALGTCGVDF